MTFTGKKVVVTGGTGALGTALVGQLLDQGASVYIPAFSGGEVEKFEFKDHERVSITTGMDLTDEDLVTGFYEKTGEVWASIHIAGGFDMSSIIDTSAAAFDRQINMNLRTSFLCSREAVKNMGAGGGRIVNIAARPGVEPRTGAGMVAYATSKAAVAAMTQAMAEELAPKRIWVNGVAPSILDTPANRAAMPDADFSQWPKLAEVAATIKYLASPENAVARGGVVPVYGQA